MAPCAAPAAAARTAMTVTTEGRLMVPYPGCQRAVSDDPGHAVSPLIYMAPPTSPSPARGPVGGPGSPGCKAWGPLGEWGPLVKPDAANSFRGRTFPGEKTFYSDRVELELLCWFAIRSTR